MPSSSPRLFFDAARVTFRNDIYPAYKAMGESQDYIEGLTILASIAFGIPLQFEKTYTEGIARITQEDIRYADELGYRIKHLGISRLA